MEFDKDMLRVKPEYSADATSGVVKWEPVRSIWYTLHLLVAVVGGVLTFTWSALIVFVLFTAFSLCLGHSLGMHRRLIHKSYTCPKWLEYLFVHFGVLVGLAGPFGMIRQHDLRDWAQRQGYCHPYLRHGSHIVKDGWWQLNCEIKLSHPPKIEIEEEVRYDPVYQWMERTWMWQQLPWALILFAMGGISWVVWGISARVFVSITGHWLVGYFAHNSGQRDWHVKGAAVQGYNVKFFAWLTMGESWHNNHHAYPGSAMLGIYPHQSDPGWWVLNRLLNLGLVWNIKLPHDLPSRSELVKLPKESIKNLEFRTPITCRLTGI